MEDEQIQTTAPETTTAPEATSERVTFSPEQQAELNRLIAREKNAALKKAQEDAAKQAERDKLDGEARAQAEKAEAEQRAVDAEQRARLASYRADLKGEVVDVNAALKLIDEEKHVKDGAVDVKLLLKDFAFLAPARSTPPGAGGVQGAAQPDTSTFAGALAADGIKFG